MSQVQTTASFQSNGTKSQVKFEPYLSSHIDIVVAKMSTFEFDPVLT